MAGDGCDLLLRSPSNRRSPGSPSSGCGFSPDQKTFPIDIVEQEQDQGYCGEF